MIYYVYYFALAIAIFLALFLFWKKNEPTTFETYFISPEQFEYLWRQKHARCTQLLAVKGLQLLTEFNHRYHTKGMKAPITAAEFDFWLSL